MAERLWEVAELAARDGVVLLGEQAHVVAHVQQPLEQGPRLLLPAGHVQGVGQPERAGQEGPLGSGQPVHRAALGAVAADEAVAAELGADGVDRADHARVVGGQEADPGDEQCGGVQLLGAVVLGERAPRGVVAVLADVEVDGLPHGAEALQVALPGGVALQGAHGPVGGDPGHHLGVDEVAARAAYLPQALVGPVPVALQEVQEGQLDPPGVQFGGQTGGPGQVQGVEDLPVHVELELVHGRVADPDGGGGGVAAQPGQFDLGDPPLAADPVHDLEVGGVSGDGAQQPFAPCAGLVEEAGREEGAEGEGGVAQPAEAVVPVADAAHLLGEGGGGGRGDTAGGGVGEGLEGDQGAGHRLPVGALVTALGGPVPPVGEALLQGRVRVHELGARFVRGVPGEDEGDALAGGDGEFGAGAVGLAPGAHGRLAAEPGGVGSGDGDPLPVTAADPGHDVSVVEAQAQGAAHGDLAGQALDDAHDVGGDVALRHEVDDLDGSAVRGVPVRLQDERAVHVGAPGAALALGGLGRCDAPVAVLPVPEERGEAGGRVEARQAQPVDGPVAADEPAGHQVADDRIVFDGLCHLCAFPPKVRLQSAVGRKTERRARQPCGSGSVENSIIHKGRARLMSGHRDHPTARTSPRIIPGRSGAVGSAAMRCGFRPAV